MPKPNKVDQSARGAASVAAPKTPVGRWRTGPAAQAGRQKDATMPVKQAVPVDPETLLLARERTGIEDPTELIEFALRLLTVPDPSADFARRTRGSIPGFDLDV